MVWHAVVFGCRVTWCGSMGVVLCSVACYDVPIWPGRWSCKCLVLPSRSARKRHPWLQTLSTTTLRPAPSCNEFQERRWCVMMKNENVNGLKKSFDGHTAIKRLTAPPRTQIAILVCIEQKINSRATSLYLTFLIDRYKINSRYCASISTLSTMLRCHAALCKSCA